MADLHSTEPHTLTIWSDLACPWATLALQTLRSTRDRLGLDIHLDHRAYPLELINRIPTSKRALDAEIPVVAAMAPEFGWRAWRRDPSQYPVSMLLPLEAVQAAKDPAVGGLVASDELDAALRRAFYVESRCITILPEVLAVARSCPGLDLDALQAALERGAGRAEVMAQWRLAASDGVSGSPHVFCPDGYAVFNPGVRMHWTGQFGGSFPVIEEFDPLAHRALLERVA